MSIDPINFRKWVNDLRSINRKVKKIEGLVDMYSAKLTDVEIAVLVDLALTGAETARSLAAKTVSRRQ